MPRLLAIDYGKRRTGVARTDAMQIIASGVGSFDTPAVEKELKKAADDDVVGIVLGWPTRPDGSDTHATPLVREFLPKLRAWFPGVPIYLWDERYSSREAMEAMIQGGVKKKQRRDKHKINEVAAVLILRGFMELPEGQRSGYAAE